MLFYVVEYFFSCCIYRAPCWLVSSPQVLCCRIYRAPCWLIGSLQVLCYRMYRASCCTRDINSNACVSGWFTTGVRAVNSTPRHPRGCAASRRLACECVGTLVKMYSVVVLCMDCEKCQHYVWTVKKCQHYVWTVKECQHYVWTVKECQHYAWTVKECQHYAWTV